MTVNGRQAKRFLTTEQKDGLWVLMLTGHLATAADEAGPARASPAGRAVSDVVDAL